MEYENGVAVRRQEAFRSYPSYEACFKDYVAFLLKNPRYAEAIRRGGNGPAAFIRNLQGAGYATDPNYANKAGAILSGLKAIAGPEKGPDILKVVESVSLGYSAEE